MCTGGYVVTSINPNPGVNVGAPQLLMEAYPNPTSDVVNIRYRVTAKTKVTIKIYDTNGKIVAIPVNNESRDADTYELKWSSLSAGVYYAVLQNNGSTVQSLKVTIAK